MTIKETKPCPECGEPMFMSHHEGTLAYPECVVWHCSECDYESDPE